MNRKDLFERAAFYKPITYSLMILCLGASACGMAAPERKIEGQGQIAAPENKPKVTISPAVVEYKKGAKVLISGSGFQPKEELSLRIFMGGTVTEVTYLVKPEPVANEYGAFAGVWVLDEEISGKVLEPKAYTITVLEESGKILCTAPLVFCDPKAEGKKKSPVCDFMEESKKPEKK